MNTEANAQGAMKQQSIKTFIDGAASSSYEETKHELRTALDAEVRRKNAASQRLFNADTRGLQPFEVASSQNRAEERYFFMNDIVDVNMRMEGKSVLRSSTELLIRWKYDEEGNRSHRSCSACLEFVKKTEFKNFNAACCEPCRGKWRMSTFWRLNEMFRHCRRNRRVSKAEWFDDVYEGYGCPSGIRSFAPGFNTVDTIYDCLPAEEKARIYNANGAVNRDGR